MNYLTMYTLYKDGNPLLQTYESAVSGVVVLFFEMADAETAKSKEKQANPSHNYMVKEIKIPCMRMLNNA